MSQSLRDRIQAWSRAYHANLHLFKNKLISKSTKLKITGHQYALS
jgi:hypothetical protein